MTLKSPSGPLRVRLDRPGHTASRKGSRLGAGSPGWQACRGWTG